MADRPHRSSRIGRRALAGIAAAVSVVVLLLFFLLVRDPDVPPEPDAGGQDERQSAPWAGDEDGYFVSPEGDDGGSGRVDDPWQTLGHALAQLRPGDDLTVAGGRYEENIDLELRPAEQATPIRVRAAEGERPVVVGLLWLEDLSWWEISGLNVTWDDANDSDQHMVKLTDGESWRFADAELWGAKSFAALLVGGRPEDFTLTGLYVHDTHPANDTNQDHLIYINSGSGGGVLERSILAHSNNGRAVKVGPPDSGDDEVSDIVIRYVTMIDNRGPSNVQLAYDVSRVVIERCLMVRSGEDRANVTTFDLSGEDNEVRYSLGWDSAGLLDEDDGLVDGPGNVVLDPRLSGPDGDRPYYPAEEQAQSFGRWAPAG